MVKVSVIVPVYNVEKYIEKCLISLVNQTLKEIEIIVVNDGSPDNSQNIIDKYVKKYPDKVKSFIKENGGLSSARNYGIANSNGEFIGFVDSDDYVDINMFELLYCQAIKENADVVSCDYYEVRSNNISIISYYDGSNAQDSKIKYILGCPCACNKLIKRELIIQNEWKFPDKIWYEDFACVPILGLYTNKISEVKKPLYYYLVHNGSIMNQLNYNVKLMDIFLSYENLCNLYENTKEKEKFKQEFEFLCLEHLLHDASLRFLKFKKYEQLKEIIKIFKKDFPNWNKNKYFQNMSLRYKIVCYLFYYRHYKVLNIILKG